MRVSIKDTPRYALLLFLLVISKFTILYDVALLCVLLFQTETVWLVVVAAAAAAASHNR